MIISSKASAQGSGRVLTLWADPGSSNLGVRVMAEGAAAVAQRSWGTYPSAVEFHDFASGPQVELGMRAIVKSCLRPRLDPFGSYFLQFARVVDSGAGDSLSDIYGLKRLLTVIYCQRRILGRGVPQYLLPQTIGPFRTRIGRLLAGRTLRAASVVMDRDSRSAHAGKARS